MPPQKPSVDQCLALLLGYLRSSLTNQHQYNDQNDCRIDFDCTPNRTCRIDNAMTKLGLYSNIHAKQERIAKGSGEKMRKAGEKGRPTAKAFQDSKKTAKKK